MRITIIISMLLIIFGSAGYYVYISAILAFSGTFAISIPVLVLYILLISSFFLGKIIDHYSIGSLSNALVKIGSIYMGLFLYAFLFVVFFDFIRLINYIIPFFPATVTADYQKTKLIIGIFSITFISLIFLNGCALCKF